jgi:hypothetical protein
MLPVEGDELMLPVEGDEVTLPVEGDEVTLPVEGVPVGPGAGSGSPGFPLPPPECDEPLPPPECDELRSQEDEPKEIRASTTTSTHMRVTWRGSRIRERYLVMTWAHIGNHLFAGIHTSQSRSLLSEHDIG